MPRMTTPSTRTDFRCLLRKEQFTDRLGVKLKLSHNTGRADIACELDLRLG